MTAYDEEAQSVGFGQGLFTADLASAIPENYCAECSNGIPTGTSVESRFGFKKANVAFNEVAFASQALPSFTHFGPTGNEDAPLIMWGSDLGGGSTEVHMIREGSPFTDPGGGLITNGYFSASVADNFVGAVNYNGTYYIFLSNQVYTLSAINWTLNTFSTVSVPGSPPSSITPIHFFDRLWTANGNKLYWTDAIASPGDLPTGWDIVNNFVSIVGQNGPGKIYKIIPLGSRLYIFTSQGLFGLTIAGNPSDWYLRPLDENAIVNTCECAFEVNGLIYYVTIYGVHVTNGGDAIKISGPIENYFLAGNFEAGDVSPGKRANLYRINYMDGGIIVSISNYFISGGGGGGTAYFDVDFCKNFYTRIANVAWSEWNYNTPDGDTKIAAITGIADAVESYINKTPLSYVMVLSTDSQDTTPRHTQRELMIYDGLRDEWTNPAGGGPSVTANVQLSIKTRYFEGTNPVDFKTFKYAYVSFYISDKTKFNDPTHWYYKWLTEQSTFDYTAEVANINPADVYGLEFNSVRLAAQFKYRIAQFELVLNTKNAVTFKVKDLVIKEHSERDGYNSIQ